MKKEVTQEEWARMISDAREIHFILDTLLAKRIELGISKKQMAKGMRVTKKELKEFESEMSYPTVSMIQRYARVLGIKVSFTFGI